MRTLVVIEDILICIPHLTSVQNVDIKRKSDEQLILVWLMVPPGPRLNINFINN